MWRPILYGCFASNGSAFDYDVIHQEQYTVARTLNALQMTTGMWVLGETDGRVFFGHHGLVGDFLGWDHTTAHDRIGRRVAFFLGYIGIQGSRLPGIRDLTSMAQQLQEDLRRLGEAARRARHPIGDAPEVELPQFQDRSGSASLWGRTLEEIEAGRRDIMVTLDQQGEQRLHDRARPAGSTAEEEESPPVMDELELLALEKQRQSKGNFFKDFFSGRKRDRKS